MGKPHIGHMQQKREQSKQDTEITNTNMFGSNVPPFPFYEPNDLSQQYAPPGNGKYHHCIYWSQLFLKIILCVAFPRMTPPFETRRGPIIQPIQSFHPIHAVSFTVFSFQTVFELSIAHVIIVFL